MFDAAFSNRNRTRRVALGVIAVAVAAAVIGLQIPATVAAPDSVFFRIGGTKVDDATFRWSAALAGVTSRPGGLPACEVNGICGIQGVIAVAQTFATTGDLIRAIQAGTVESGIASANIVQASRCEVPPAEPEPPVPEPKPAPVKAAKGAAAKSPAKEAAAKPPAAKPPAVRAAPEVRPAEPPPSPNDLRVLGNLYREQLHVIARSDARIGTIADLAGKTVLAGDKDSATELVARALFDAAALARKVKLQTAPWALAVETLAQGKASAMVFLGPQPDPRIAELMGQGGYTLVPIAGAVAQKLIRPGTVFAPEEIPADAYPGSLRVETVGQYVQWIVRGTVDAKLAYKLTDVLWSPANRRRLTEMTQPIRPGEPGTGWTAVAAPLSEGARKYYVEKGVPGSELPCPGRS